jgi:hypothetical protein
MTVKVGSVLLVEDTIPDTCQLCDKTAELRPYGPGGKDICLDCGRRDPVGTTERMDEILKRLLEGTTHVVGPNGKILRV